MIAALEVAPASGAGLVGEIAGVFAESIGTDSSGGVVTACGSAGSEFVSLCRVPERVYQIYLILKNATLINSDSKMSYRSMLKLN